MRCDLTGAGPLVVFLHGWTLDRRMWQPQVAALRDRYRVAVIDRRGFGHSTAPPGADLEPGDIDALLDILGEERCVLVGMSQGGRMALRYARYAPHRLTAMAVQGAPLDGFAPPPAGEAIPLDDYRRLWREAPAAMKAAWRAHPHMQHLNPASADLVAAMIEAYDGRDLIAPLTPPVHTCTADDLSSLHLPVLAITGAHDTPWLQVVADEIVARTPHGERHVVADAGHMANLSHATAYNAMLTAWLGRVVSR